MEDKVHAETRLGIMDRHQGASPKTWYYSVVMVIWLSI